MANVQPFKALRFDASRAPDASVDAEAVARAPDPVSVLTRWRAAGFLIEEPASMYVLEMGPEPLRREPVHFLLGAVGPDAKWLPLEGGKDAATRGSPMPLPAVAADDHGYLRQVLRQVVDGGSPDLETRYEGRTLRLWKVTASGTLRRLRQLLDEVPVRPCGQLPESDRALVAVTPLSEPGLQLEPVHRAIRSVQTFEAARFLALVKDYARVYPLDAPLTTNAGLEEARERLAGLSHGHHAVLLVLPEGEGRILRFRQALELTHVPAVPRNPTLRSLDLALLNALVLRTVLGIQEPEKPGHSQVFSVHGLERLVEEVQKGMYQAGFGLNPPPVWELRAVMEAQQLLPPNTLQLAPVPPAGLLYLSP